MSEYDGMDRMAGDGLMRPTAASSAPGSSGTPGPHAYVAQSPRVLARMPDMGPETTATASEEPVPTEHEGRLIGARLSANVLVGGVLLLMLSALVPYLFMKGSGSGHTESPAPGAAEAPRWNGSNSQVSNWPAPLSRDSAHANDNSPTGNNAPGSNNDVSPGAASFQNAAVSTPPGVQPIQPTPVPAANGNSLWNGQAPQTSAADATGSWGGGSRGAWPNPSGAAGTAIDRATTTWGDASQSIGAVPQAARLADPNRPVGPMMPTAPPLQNGIYEAASPAPAYQNNSSDPRAYTADARGSAAMAPSGPGAATGPSSYPNTGAGTTYPSVSPSNAYPPNNYSPTNYPPSGNPPNSYSPNNYSPSGYPTNISPPSNSSSPGYPANASPSNNSSFGGYPSPGYPANGNPPSNSSSGGYPSNNYPSNNANAPNPGTGGPAVAPTTNGAASYYGGTVDPARAQFGGGIERPTIPGG